MNVAFNNATKSSHTCGVEATAGSEPLSSV